MTTTITRRIAAAPAASNTRRVNIGTHAADYDCWAGSWGASWGLTWHNFFSASELSDNITQRVTVNPTTNITRRVGTVA